MDRGIFEPCAGIPNSSGDLALTGDWVICLPDSPHRAVERAAEDLQSFMRDRHRLETKVVRGTRAQGVVLLVDEGQKDDRFSLRSIPDASQLRVEGSSPRAVYQAVLLLEDRLAERPALPETYEATIVFPFRDRYLIWDVCVARTP